MIIDKSRYEKVLKAANVLLLIAIIIYCITAVAYFIMIAMQNKIMTESPGPFIIPVIPVITFLCIFGSVVAFSILIMKKDVNANMSIALEIIALVVTIFLSTIFSMVLSLIFEDSLVDYEIDYIRRYSILTCYLNYTKILMPYGTLLFNIGVSIKLVCGFLNPVETK